MDRHRHGGLRARLGHSEFFLDRAHAPADSRRRAVARHDDAAGPAVAAQIPRADDDGELRRPDDRRYRYRQLPVHDLPGAALDCDAVRDRPCSAHSVCVAVRSVSYAPHRRGSVGDRLPWRPHRARNTFPDAAVRSVLRRQPRFVLRTLRRRCRVRTDDARAHAIGRLCRRTAQADRRLRARSQTAAHHPYS